MDLQSLPRAGQYACVLADPPWSFKTWSGKTGTPHRSANDHYVCQTVESIGALKLADVCAPDCAMFMWTVDSHIDQGIELARHWGFGFKTVAFVWCKTTAKGTPRIGMGYWTRKGAEICLMFTRGKPSRNDKGVRQVIIAPRREHSRKPDEQYERIERLVAGPYLELFARQSRPGWDSWGNETTKFDMEAA